MAGITLDDSDLFELAPDALLAIAHVATRIGADKRDRHFGELGGRLATLSESLQCSITVDQEEKSRGRIRKLLRELERVCTVCKVSMLIVLGPLTV